MSNLSLARHDYELQPDSMNHVYLDHRHMGLGGDDSWSPSVHEVQCIQHKFHNNKTLAIALQLLLLKCCAT